MTPIDGILLVAAGYLGIGLLFGIAFITVGIARVDPAARGAPLAFRLLILPGVTALWPVLAVKWARRPSPETDA